MIVPVYLALTGGITSSAILTPSVGVLLRLSVSCYLGIPLASVLITEASDSAEELSVHPTDEVNVIGGSCAALSGRALRPLRSGRMLDSTGVIDGAQSTNVSLTAVIPACASIVGSSPAISPALVDLLASMGASAQPSSSSNTTASSGLPTPPQYGAFITAAAAASGVSPSGVSATSSTGTPQVAPTAQDTSVSAAPSAAGFPILIVAAAAGAALLLCVAVIVILALRRRKPSQSRPGPSNSEHIVDDLSGVNPMRAAIMKRVVVERRVASHSDAGSANDNATGMNPMYAGMTDPLYRRDAAHKGDNSVDANSGVTPKHANASDGRGRVVDRQVTTADPERNRLYGDGSRSKRCSDSDMLRRGRRIQPTPR